ncbi:hypothetical protein QTN25_008696 [Entamoeba marina]
MVVMAILSTIHCVQISVSFMCVMLASQMFVKQIYFITRNDTLIESKIHNRRRIMSSKTSKKLNKYDLGVLTNCKEMFGDNIFKALLPIQTTKGDGYNFITNTEHLNYNESNE